MSCLVAGYAFEVVEQAQIMGNTVFSGGAIAASGRYVQRFESAVDMRAALACASPEVQAVVSNECVEVSPLNLAAALCKDTPLRDVYLLNNEPSALLATRVGATGARGIMSVAEAEQLLGLALGYTLHTDELAWLEEVLDLDDIDECATSLPVLTQAPAGAIAGCSASLGWSGAAGGPASVAGLASAPFAQATVAPSVAAPPEALAAAPLAPLYTAPASSATLVLDAPKQRTVLAPAQGTPPQLQYQPLANAQQDTATAAAFVSGRGGVGRSTLAVLTACRLWQRGTRVALVDLDLQFGDLSQLVGTETALSVQRVGLEQLACAQAALPKTADALLLIEAPALPEAAEELAGELSALLAELKTRYELVLINTSCLWNETLAVCARSVNELVICMDQRATSVSAARRVKELCERLQIPSTRLKYLLNRCAKSAPFTNIDASLALGGAPVLTVAEGGSDVDELLSLGCPLELLAAAPALRSSVEELGAQLLQGAQGGAK